MPVVARVVVGWCGRRCRQTEPVVLDGVDLSEVDAELEVDLCGIVWREQVSLACVGEGDRRGVRCVEPEEVVVRYDGEGGIKDVWRERDGCVFPNEGEQVVCCLE